MAPTARGIGTVLAGAALGTAGFLYGYPELVVLGAAGLVAALCAVAYVAWRPALSVTRDVDPDRVTRGEPSTQTLTVSNASRLRAATLIAQDVCGNDTVPVPLLRLRPGHDTTVEYPVPTQRRGVVVVGPLRVTRRDPLGLVGASQSHGGTARVWVHPRTHPLLAVPVGVARSLDGRVDKVPHGSITFDTLREYVLGDELRKVHWRTSARVGQLMVREDLDTSLPRIVVVVDDRRSAYRDLAGKDPEDASADFESVCEAAASVVVAAVRADLAVELLLASGEQAVGTTTHRASGPADTRPMLDQLAEAQPRAADDVLDLATRRLRQHKLGDTLIYLTGSGRPEDLAPVGALAPGYPTVVAGVFGDPDGVPATVAGMQVLTATDAADFATAWDSLGRW
jgi:uncharacterized protein (DUF58 family)